MKTIIVLMLIILAGIASAENISINKVLYDPIGTESGGESVELINPTAHAIDISGWTLRTESSSTDATIPEGTFLNPNETYLIADAGWFESRDNMSWKDADHEEALSMTNDNAGVALVDVNDDIIDAVGWGDPLAIDDGLYETYPAQDTGEGDMLIRIADTGDNSLDFNVTIAEFDDEGHVETQPDGTIVLVSANISNSPPSIESILIETDDFETEGIQIIPIPGNTREIPIEVVVSDPDGAIDVQNVIVSFAGGTEVILERSNDNESAVFTGNIPVDFYTPHGYANLSVTASDFKENVVNITELEVMEVVAISIDSGYLDFEDVMLGRYSTIYGDAAYGTTDPTIRNIGNTPVDLGIYGSDLSGGNTIINIENMIASFDNSFESELSTTVQKTATMLNTSLGFGIDMTLPLAFQLYIPPETEDGEYATQINIVAEGS